MFKDMSADSFLVDAGIATHWPYGRGCYISEDGGFIIWVGEEDHCNFYNNFWKIYTILILNIIIL